MRHAEPNQKIHFNPPLRIFSNSESAAGTLAAPLFSRPVIQRHVTRERIAQYLGKKHFSFSSPLD